jgi:hypothetical protein
MNCCGLSSTGLNDIEANNITSDNITIYSNLNVSGITNLYNSLNVSGITNLYNSLNVQGVNILNSINNLNSIINNDSSNININASNNIFFNVNNTQFTKIDSSGLSVFHAARETIFPYNYEGWYNIGDRLNKLYHVMEDSPDNIINFDTTHNTVIRFREQDIINNIYYPRQIQFQSFEGTTFSKFDISGLQLLDKYNNWYYINKLFSITNNSTLLCSDKVMVDSSGDLKVYFPSTNTWLNVADNLFSNNTQSIVEQINTATNSIIGAVGALAALSNYYQSLQLTVAVVAGVAVGSGLLLAFTLKEDKFDAKLPLIKRPPDTSKQEYYPQLELKYNKTLILNDANELAVNTTGFLCPYFGDLSLASTPSNITSNSSTYVVVTQLSQPITCFSSLNVNGYTTLNNNVTCKNNLTVDGALFCSSINSSTTTVLSSSLNSLSTYSSLNISNLQSTSNTIFSNLNSISAYSSLNISNLQSTSTTILNNLNSLSSCSILNVNNLNVSGTSIFNNDVTANSNLYALNLPKKSTFNIIMLTPCMIGSTTYYKYDLDLRLYTKVKTIAPTTTTRKFKFMCWMRSGAHKSGLNSLNYDIDYSFCSNLTANNGLNVLAYGFPYENLRLDKITPNGLFIWKVDFDYITIFSKSQIDLEAIIIDYL